MNADTISIEYEDLCALLQLSWLPKNKRDDLV